MLLVLFANASSGISETLGIVNADVGNSYVPVSQLLATGKFSSVTAVDAKSSTPTLSTLLGFDAVLAYTNSAPADPTALGNVLADYVDAGHKLELCTWAFSNPWEISGRIMTSRYSPLTNLGVNGTVSGNLVATLPEDPIFNDVSLSNVSYFKDDNFAHPGLDDKATLLATDGAGVDMIARNASGSVVAMNFYPGTHVSGDNAALYTLIANGLSPAPEPSTLALLAAGALGLLGYGLRRRRAARTCEARSLRPTVRRSAHPGPPFAFVPGGLGTAGSLIEHVEQRRPWQRVFD